MFKLVSGRSFMAGALLMMSFSSAHADSFLSNQWFSENADAKVLPSYSNFAPGSLFAYLRQGTSNVGTRAFCRVTVYGKINGRLSYIEDKTYYSQNNNCSIVIPKERTAKIYTRYDNIEVRWTSDTQRQLAAATFKVEYRR